MYTTCEYCSGRCQQRKAEYDLCSVCFRKFRTDKHHDAMVEELKELKKKRKINDNVSFLRETIPQRFLVEGLPSDYVARLKITKDPEEIEYLQKNLEEFIASIKDFKPSKSLHRYWKF